MISPASEIQPGLFSWRGILERARATNRLTKPVVFYIIAVKITRVISAHYFWPLLIHGGGRNGSRAGLDWCPANYYAPLIRVWAINPTNDNARCPFIEPLEVITSRNTLLRIRIWRSVQRPSTNFHRPSPFSPSSLLSLPLYPAVGRNLFWQRTA